MNILKKHYIKYEEPIVSKIHRDKSPFKVLISTMISLRTKDKVTAQASYRLFSLADNPISMNKLTIKQIEEAIYPAGFYKNKARAIKQTCKILIDKYNGNVPNTLEQLLTLPGVGRKTANLVLSLGFNIDAICVDTHVHRISNRMGIINTKTPEQTEYALMKVLPKKWWRIYNDILVTWGQNVCTPISPYCSICCINKLCDKKDVKIMR